MKKAISLILIITTLLCALPICSRAAEGTVLNISSRNLESTYICWYTDGCYYDGTLIEKSENGEDWQVFKDTGFGNYYGYEIKTEPKSFCLFRVRSYTLEKVWNDDGEVISESRHYAEPSNTVEIHPVLEYFYNAWGYQSDNKLNFSWSVESTAAGYIDGFDILGAAGSTALKKVGTVGIKKTSSKTSSTLYYTFSIAPPSKTAYTYTYTVKPYFLNGTQKIYLYNSEETRIYYYVSNTSLVNITTARKAVKLNFGKVEGCIKYRVKYTKYNLKTGKSSKAKTVDVPKRSYTLPGVDTKYYGYYIEVIPIWKHYTPDYGVYTDSHNPYALLNSAPKSKDKTIKVVNNRGKKTYTDWSYKLTAADSKIIKKFFDKKYKGKYPSRAAMADYALNWINQKVKYAYNYNKISGKRYVDAIFNYRYGQCLQYNGAFAAVLTYLGYEARVIEGYRMNSKGKPVINHFWCEVKLNGRWYLCETGNYQSNGYWQYFVSLYRNSRGYARNGKRAVDY